MKRRVEEMLNEEDTKKMLEELNRREFKIRNEKMIESFIVRNEDKKRHRNDYRIGVEGKRVLRRFVSKNDNNYYWFFTSEIGIDDVPDGNVGDSTGD